jgi:hypothetical protein
MSPPEAARGSAGGSRTYSFAGPQPVQLGRLEAQAAEFSR